MTGRRLTLAGSDRARIPFAVVGALVLVASSVTVVSIGVREQPRTDVDVGTAVDRLSSRANGALRAAAVTGLREAAAAPVTDPANTSLGRALDPVTHDPGEGGYADAVFRNYAELRIYLAARERFDGARVRLPEGTVGRLSLPPVRNDTTSVTAALDSVETSIGRYTDHRPTGLVAVTLQNITLTVREGGTVVTNRSRSVRVTVPTTVFEMHERTQEYERRLETGFFEAGFRPGKLYYGFGRKFALRQYPVSWGKAYFDRFAPVAWGRAFPTVHDHRTTEILANDAIYSVQRATFGTADPGADRIMRERWLCLGLTTVYDVLSARGASDPTATVADRIVNGTMQSWIDDLNRSARRVLDRRLRSIQTSLGHKGIKKAICGATEFLRTSGHDLPAVPSVADVVGGSISRWQRGNAPSPTGNTTVEVDRIADAAYYNATGQNVTRQLRRDLPDPANQSEFDTPDPNSSHDFPTPGSGTVGAAGDATDRIDEAIADVYAVSVTVTERTDGEPLPTAPAKGGNWSQIGDSYAVTDAGRPAVTSVAGPDGTPPNATATTLQNVSVVLTNGITHTRAWERPCSPSERNATGMGCPRRDTTATSEDLRFRVALGIEASHSQRAGVERRGMVHAYDAGGPGPGPNYGGVRPEAIDAVFGYGGGTTGLAAALEARIDPASVLTAGDLAAEVGYDTTVSVDAAPNTSEHAALAGWVATELNATRSAVRRRVRPLELNRTAVVADDDALAPLAGRVDNHSAALTYANVTGRYENPAEKARAELRRRYLRDVIQRIERSQQAASDRMATVENKLDGPLGTAFGAVDDGIGKSLRFARSALSGNVTTREGRLRGSPLYDDVEYVVDASPTYLSTGTVTRGDVPAVRAPDGGPTDLNATVEHAPMVAKYDNLVLPYPGLPVLPPVLGFAPAWYVTLSTWYLQIDAEYARFELRAEIDDPVRPGTTSYVREARPVALTITDGPATAGRVEALEFESDTFVVVVVPSYLRQPRGTPGVGDTWEHSPTQFWGCAGPFPHEGPAPGSQACPYLLD